MRVSRMQAAAFLAAGGVLASLTSAAEDKFVFDLASTVSAAWQLDSGGNGRGPWLGGVQAPNSNEPAGGWSWSDGSPRPETRATAW